jgi:glyceraldehyde-3-phosphate dehydrogenase/erythrose-4-phosphate dehydrogenase
MTKVRVAVNGYGVIGKRVAGRDSIWFRRELF